jgi:hypothetical protein
MTVASIRTSPLFDDHRDRMRYLLAKRGQGLLPNDLGHPHLERLIGDLVRWVERRSLRHEAGDQRSELVHALAGPRRDRHDLVERAEVCGGLEVENEVVVGHAVDLVDGAHLGAG